VYRYVLPGSGSNKDDQASNKQQATAKKGEESGGVRVCGCAVLGFLLQVGQNPGT
jgi:hypothetical protein